jgi:hypothetical protein
VLLAVETLWDSLLSEDAKTDEPETDEAPPTEEVLVMAISKAAVSTSSATRTVRLSALIAGHPMIVLVDSGSSASFISAQLVNQLGLS